MEQPLTHLLQGQKWSPSAETALPPKLLTFCTDFNRIGYIIKGSYWIG